MKRSAFYHHLLRVLDGDLFGGFDQELEGFSERVELADEYFWWQESVDD